MEGAAVFHRQVILITGGTGALGSAVARAFLQQGANVAVTYRAQREYDELQTRLSSQRAQLRGYQADG